MKPKHKRLIVVLVSLVCIFTGTFMLLDIFRDNLIYFYPPEDIASIQSAEPERFARLLKKQVRVGGMIKKGSYKKTGELEHSFTITDFSNDLDIKYTGLLPPMFREGQGVVAQGMLVIKPAQTRHEAASEYYFLARQLLTKHDERYMPPEVNKGLEKK